MLEAIRLDLPVSRLRLAELGRWLCRFGVHAGQVKGALALLGISGTPGDVALVSRLGLLDPVTLYAAVALRNLVPAAQAETALFDLAKQVEARGRIHCSPERLLSLKTIDHYLRGDARRNTNLTDRGRAELRVLLDRALDRADWRRSEGRPG